MYASLLNRLKQRQDSEHEQVVIKLVLGIIWLVYISVTHQFHAIQVDIFTASLLYIASSVLIFLWVVTNPRINVYRRSISMLLDVFFITYAMFYTDALGSVLFGAYLFITFGYGFRYGVKYLIACALMSITGLSIVMYFNEYWAQQAVLNHGIMLTFIVLSIYAFILLGFMAKRMLKEGDIVGLDLGLWYGGMCVDMAVTVGVGAVGATAQKLIEVTRQSLSRGITAVRNGARTGDIGFAIASYVEKNGFGVVRDLAGHGVGYKVHEDPLIMNFGKKGTGEQLLTGMTIALEPMVTEGDWHVTIDRDGWTIRTRDGKLAAHFEHTLVVMDDGCEILTEL